MIKRVKIVNLDLGAEEIQLCLGQDPWSGEI